jgi:zinc transport system substrate-binding protein
MKLTSIFRISVLSAFLILAGCSSQEGNQAEKKSGEKTTVPVVYVSNYPLQYFVERIAASLVEVRFPAKTANDPAYWNPIPEEVAAMQQADLIVLNGASYEQWLKDVSLPQSRIVISADSFKERFIPLEETVTHSHGLEGEHEHSGTAFTTWLDLTLAIEQARAVKNGLVARRAEHELQFEERFAKLENDLRTLDEEIAAIIVKTAQRPVLFSHPVYQYLQRRYGMNGRSVHWEPDRMPGESMWNELQQLRKLHPAKWMIWESKPLTTIADQLNRLGVESVVFDPCENIPAEGDFISIMRRNVETLQRIYQ